MVRSIRFAFLSLLILLFSASFASATGYSVDHDSSPEFGGYFTTETTIQLDDETVADGGLSAEKLKDLCYSSNKTGAGLVCKSGQTKSCSQPETTQVDTEAGTIICRRTGCRCRPKKKSIIDEITGQLSL